MGTNCGLIGQNALSYSNGIVFWMSGEGGFFMYDGTVKTIPCLVEDFVFTTTGDNLGINYSAAEIVMQNIILYIMKLIGFIQKQDRLK